MNIKGQDVLLTVIFKPVNHKNVWTETYKAGTVKIRIDFKLLPCEGCDGFGLEGNITATEGKIKQRMKANGYSGC